MGDPSIGKAARNEQRRVRARFWNAVSIVLVVLSAALFERPHFMSTVPLMPAEPSWDWSWSSFFSLLGEIYPPALVLLCATSCYSKAQKAAGEIED
jgi:hypothetical protein